MFCAQSDPWTKDEEEVSYMFMLFEFMFPIIFVMVFGMIIFQFVTGIGTWHKNNQSPRLSVSATVVAKRENVSHHSHPNGGDPSGAHLEDHVDIVNGKSGDHNSALGADLYETFLLQTA